MSASFKRQDVVHAVTGHRHHVPLRLQGLDHRALLVRGDASEDRVRVEHLGELLTILGQRLRIERRLGAGESDPASDGGDRLGMVAADDLDLDPLLLEVRERRRRRLAHAVREDHVGDRNEPGRWASAVERGLGPPEEHDAPSRLGVFTRLPQICVVAPRGSEQNVGRPEDPGSLRAELHAAPLPGRRERDRSRREPAGGMVGEALADRAEGGVRVRVGGRQRGERLPVRPVPAEELDLVDDEPALGERSGLVDAQHVHARERLDGRQLLHQHPPPCEPNHAHRERHARQQNETLGDHRDGPGHGPSERLAHARVRVELADHQQRRGRDDQPRHDPQDLVDPGPELRTRQAEPPALLGEPCRVGLGADARGPEPSAPRRDERARKHLLPRRLDHGLGFAGQQRLVDLERRRLEHLAVDHDLVPGLQLEHVVEHDLGHRRFANLAVADDPPLRRGQHREAVERPLRPQLLEDPDARVRDQDEAEQRVLDRPDDEDHDEERPEEGS